MAKSIKLVVGQVVELNYPLIHHFHDDNSRQESFNNPLSDLDFKFDAPGQFNDGANQGKGLVRALFDGWQVKHGAMTVIPIDAFASMRKMTVEQVLDKVRADRLKLIAEWEADENLKGLANVAKRVWFPDGEMVAPIAIGNDCYRRSYAVMGVLYKRTLQGSFDGNLTYAIKVLPQTFSSELDRIVDHAQENDKDKGRSEYAPLDYLKLALQIVRAIGGESDVVRAGVKRGTAQKVHRTAKLSEKFPSVRLVERCFLPAPNTVEFGEYSPEGYVSLAKIDKEAVKLLLDNFWYNDKGRTTPVEITPAKVHQYLAEIMTGRQEKAPAMAMSKVGEMGANHASKFVRAFCKAITSNDAAFFSNLTPYHDEIDSLWEEVQRAQGVVIAPPAEQPAEA